MNIYKFRCQSCDESLQFSKLFINTDYITGDIFDIISCSKCGLGHTAFNKGSMELAKYYPPAYYGSGGEKALFGPFNLVMHFFRTIRSREIHNKFKTPGKILDVGCGSAVMLSHLNELGWDCVGTERTEISAEKAKADAALDIRVAQDILECQFKDNEFDVITMFHVLEHIADLNRLIIELKRILKPGGILIIEVPNLASYQARLGKGRWFHIDAPRHLLHFTKNSLKNAFTKNGLKQVGLSTASVEMGYFGVLQTILNIITGKQNILYGSLMRKSVKNKRSNSIWLAVHTVLIPPALLIGLALETIAILARNGSVLRAYFQK